MDQSTTEWIKMIAEALNIDIATWSGKRELATRFWEMAGAKAPKSSWSPEYLHGILKGTTAPSKIFLSAVNSLGFLLDGMNSDIAKSTEVSVFVLGEVRPGTLIKGDSKRCGYPPCPINYIPRDKRQRYHGRECRDKDYKRIKQNGSRG